MAIYKNITSATTEDLIKKNAVKGNVNCINLTNFGAQPATVSLFTEDAVAAETTNIGNNKFFYINTIIPSNTTLQLDKNLSFDSRIYNLRITIVGTAPKISVLIT
tara:strand:- start:2139 stop:2453 length:315 start_codon:yes stop_codon:yes gene_type:complete